MEEKEINKNDILIQSFYPIDRIPVLRFTHVPSGLSVEYKEAEGKPFLLKQRALKELAELLANRESGD